MEQDFVLSHYFKESYVVICIEGLLKKLGHDQKYFWNKM